MRRLVELHRECVGKVERELALKRRL